MIDLHLRSKKWRKKKIYVDVFVSLLLHITEGTYHRKFGKFARFSMFRSWAKILLFLSKKTFQVLIFENIHITKSYVITFLVNIYEHANNLQDLSSQNPC